VYAHEEIKLDCAPTIHDYQNEEQLNVLPGKYRAESILIMQYFHRFVFSEVQLTLLSVYLPGVYPSFALHGPNGWKYQFKVWQVRI
jgi:hypothetical protein